MIPAKTQRDQQRDRPGRAASRPATGWSGRTPARCCRIARSNGSVASAPTQQERQRAEQRLAPTTGPGTSRDQPRPRAGQTRAPAPRPATTASDGPAEVALHRGVGLGRGELRRRMNTSLAAHVDEVAARHPGPRAPGARTAPTNTSADSPTIHRHRRLAGSGRGDAGSTSRVQRATPARRARSARQRATNSGCVVPSTLRKACLASRSPSLTAR